MNYKKNEYFTGILSIGRLLSVTASSQILVQVIGLICGILIIRNFSISEYALYTLSNTLLGAMNILADGGIVMGVLVEGGKVYSDRRLLGSVVMTGLKLRKIFAIASVTLSGSVLIYLLMRNGASFWYSILTLCCILPSFYANLTDAIYETGPKLHQKLAALQVNQISANVGRLLLTLSTVFIFPFTFVALLVNGIPRYYANIKLKKIASEDIDFEADESPIIRRRILSLVKKILPISLYNIFSVQITIWILSIFGSENSIAQAGALFRIGTLLTVFSIVSSTMIIPRIARLTENRKQILKYVLTSQVLILVVLMLIVGFVDIFSTLIIQIFGSNYIGLNNELVLTIIVFAVNVFATQQYNINASRGWVLNPLVIVAFNIISIALGAYLFNLESLSSVLKMNIAVSLILLLVNIVFCYLKILKIKSEHG